VVRQLQENCSEVSNLSYLVYPGLERIPLRHGAQAISLQALAEILAQA
jgi:hypothetical protein